jgi:hypothetical protein
VSAAYDRIQIRNTPHPSESVSPYNENDIVTERRLTAAETRIAAHDKTLEEFREVINRARTQIAFAAAGGSLVGPIISGVILWLLTK